MKDQNCDCSSVELVVDWKSEKITNSVHCSVTLLWDESCAITTIGLNQPKKVQLYHLLKIQNSSHGESLKGGQWFFQQSICRCREMLLFRIPIIIASIGFWFVCEASSLTHSLALDIETLEWFVFILQCLEVLVLWAWLVILHSLERMKDNTLTSVGYQHCHTWCGQLTSSTKNRDAFNYMYTKQNHVKTLFKDG